MTATEIAYRIEIYESCLKYVSGTDDAVIKARIELAKNYYKRKTGREFISLVEP